MPVTDLLVRAKPHLAPLVPGLLAVGLFLVWAVHDGGYDQDTWYWGALVMLGLAFGTAASLGIGGLRLPPRARLALGCFALYVAWSYLSMLWAQDPGAALEGSNRALLYLLTFGLFAALPWTERAALVTLLAFAVGVGSIVVVLLIRLATGSHVGVLFQQGRLAAPTGYFNSTAALFTMGALSAVTLATRRELPGPVRGLLVAFATADLDLALMVQSRGWLFTLPLVALAGIVAVRARLRVTAAVALAAGGVLISARPLLRVYQNTASDPLQRLAVHAGRPALMVCGGVFVVSTLVAWADRWRGERTLGSRSRAALGTILAIGAVAAVCASALVISKGHPVGFISRQWHGFAHEPSISSSSSSSHFTDVGSGRYDFWRVAVDAFRAHPIGGLGQDNFADYYTTHRHTSEEPQWTHSLEMRLLAHTGIVGFVLFAGFLVFAITLAARARRTGSDLQRGVAGAALLPLIVWLIHGSLDWFWEFPALSASALGLLGIACSLAAAPAGAPSVEAAATVRRRRPRARALTWIGGLMLLSGACAVLGFPYLSVREVSIATDIQGTNPVAALHRLKTAGRLNPLDSNPGRVAGSIALLSGAPAVARTSFTQSIDREPGGWFAWLGAGLAASALHRPGEAHHDFVVARSINRQEPAIVQALRRVYSRHPLTAFATFRLLGPIK